MGSQYCIPAQDNIVTAVTTTCTVRPSLALNRASWILESLKVSTSCSYWPSKDYCFERRKTIFQRTISHYLWVSDCTLQSDSRSTNTCLGLCTTLFRLIKFFGETSSTFTMTIACFEALRTGVLYYIRTVFSSMCHTRGTAKTFFHFHSKVTGDITYSSLI